MEKKFNASLEVVYFECDDIITTSGDHDNGYVDGEGLPNAVRNLIEKVGKIFD